VAGLRWQDVNLEAGIAEVVEVVAASDDGPVVTTPKTGNSHRTVYLSPDTVQLLCEERACILSAPVRGHASGYQRKRAWVDSGRVFVDEFGATLDPHNLRRDILRICEAAGVCPLPIHGLRHTYASLSLRRAGGSGEQAARAWFGGVYPDPVPDGVRQRASGLGAEYE